VSHTLAEKEIPMSEAEQESSDRIELPIDIPIPVSSEEANTFHASRIRLDKAAAGAEADFIMQAYIRAYHAVVPMRTIEEEEAEEREWDAIVSQPHVQQALRRMAAEVRRQIASGEIEEGGFVIE
jgi:hypothetical protein